MTFWDKLRDMTVVSSVVFGAFLVGVVAGSLLIMAGLAAGAFRVVEKPEDVCARELSRDEVETFYFSGRAHFKEENADKKTN